MDTFFEINSLILKRPFIWLSLCLFIMPYCIFEYMIIFPLVYGIFSIGSGNVFEVIIYSIQFILSGFYTLQSNFPNNIFAMLIFFLVVFFSGIVFSGYLYVLNGMINDREVKFRNGVKKYFVRINSGVLIFSVVMLIFFFFAIITSLPALVITRTVTESRVETVLEKNITSSIDAVAQMSVEISLVMVNFVTITALIFEALIIFVYFSFWFASIYSFDSGSFAIAKTVVNKYFWELILKTLMFGILFFSFEIIITLAGMWFTKSSFSTSIEIFFIVFINSLIKSILLENYLGFILIHYRNKKRIILNSTIS